MESSSVADGIQFQPAPRNTMFVYSLLWLLLFGTSVVKPVFNLCVMVSLLRVLNVKLVLNSITTQYHNSDLGLSACLVVTDSLPGALLSSAGLENMRRIIHVAISWPQECEHARVRCEKIV